MGVTAALMGVKMISDVMGTRQQYKAQEAAYKAQAEAAQQNANIVARQREQQAEAYAQKQGELNNRMRLARGQALAAAGASGATGDGSVADILSSSEEQYEQDSLNLLQNQRNDSWSAYVNQVNYLNQVDAYNTAAKNAVKQGRQKMFSTILGNAASIYATGTDQGWWGGSSGNAASAAATAGNTGAYLPATNWVGNVPRSKYLKTNIGEGIWTTKGGYQL